MVTWGWDDDEIRPELPDIIIQAEEYVIKLLVMMVYSGEKLCKQRVFSTLVCSRRKIIEAAKSTRRYPN